MTRRSFNATCHRNRRRVRGSAIAVLLVAVLAPGMSAGGQRVPSAPRIPSAAEFKRADVQARQRILRAWAHGVPETAGIGLLPLLDAGLRDADRDVRLYAVGVVHRVANEANRARVTGRPVVTDPGAYPSVYRTLLALLDHPDPIFRGGVVGALSAFDVAPRDGLDRAILTRFATEVPSVRARMVTALAESATRGSGKARAVVLATLDDSDPRVKESAIKTMRDLRDPGALPVLLREASAATEPWIRKTAVQVVRAYGESAKAYGSVLREALTRETDPGVRAELERTVEKLAPNR